MLLSAQHFTQASWKHELLKLILILFLLFFSLQFYFLLFKPNRFQDSLKPIKV